MSAGSGGIRQGAGGYAQGPYGGTFGRPAGQAMYNTGGADPALPGNSAFGIAGGNGTPQYGTPRWGDAPGAPSGAAPGGNDGGGVYTPPGTGGGDPNLSPGTGGLDPATGGQDPGGIAPTLGRYQPPQGPYAPGGDGPNLGRYQPPQGPYSPDPNQTGVTMPMSGGLLGGAQMTPEDLARQQQLGRTIPISYGFRG